MSDMIVIVLLLSSEHLGNIVLIYQKDNIVVVVVIKSKSVCKAWCCSAGIIMAVNCAMPRRIYRYHAWDATIYFLLQVEWLKSAICLEIGLGFCDIFEGDEP